MKVFDDADTSEVQAEASSMEGFSVGTLLLGRQIGKSVAEGVGDTVAVKISQATYVWSLSGRVDARSPT